MTGSLVLQGHRGLLGGAIFSAARARDERSPIAFAEARHLGEALSSTRQLDLTASLSAHDSGGLDWICAGGLVDPRVPAEQLLAANFELPRRVLLALCDLVSTGRLASARFVTFGSALETRAALAASNAYLASKHALWDCWCRESAGMPVQWHHIQLHTLYGGEHSHPFMFLGQMEAALRASVPFRMSGGRQLREYHHVADIAESVLSYRDDTHTAPRCFDLSSGDPVSLGALARAVFEAFGRPDLLEIGAVPVAAGEVFEREFALSPFLRVGREPVAGVIDWLASRNLVGGSRCPS